MWNDIDSDIKLDLENLITNTIAKKREELADYGTLEYKEGDLFKLTKTGDVVLHNCNCMCTWGAGFAKAAKNRFRHAYIADMNTRKGDSDKLGQFTWAKEDDGVTVVNIYGQYRYGRDKRHLCYNALNDALRRINDFYKGKHIIMPRIGSDLAGGDWGDIERLICLNLKDCHVTVVTLPE